MTSLTKVRSPQEKNFFDCRQEDLLSLWTALYHFQHQSYNCKATRNLFFLALNPRNLLDTKELILPGCNAIV